MLNNIFDRKHLSPMAFETQPTLSPRRIFVTGSTGLVGAHLLSNLLEQGVQVRALKRKSSNLEIVRKILGYYHADPEAAFRRIEWCEGDLLSPEFMGEALRGVDQVYHCAAMVSFDPRNRQQLFSANVDGTVAIVGEALKSGIEKFCFVSSTAALGKPAGLDEAFIDETTPWENDDGLSDYALSKYLAEQEVWRGVREGLNAVIVNPPIVIGPGDWSRSSSKLFGAAWKGLNFYPGGTNAFVDVRDVVKASIQLMDSPIHSERFIVAAENLTYQQLFNLIAVHLDKQQPRLRASRWMGEIAWRLEWLASRLAGTEPKITRATVASASKKYFFSNEKIKRELGYVFIPIEQAVQETCRRFLEERGG